MKLERRIRDHYLPPDPEAFRRAEPPTGRVIVIAPTRAACETIELACRLEIETVLEQQHGAEVRELARQGRGFGIVAATGTGKTLAIRPIAEEIVGGPLKIGVVNREREATPETPTWNVVIVTTGIARRWFQDELIDPHDTLVVDEIHQTSAELELCLALGKRVGCRFIWLSATVDPRFYTEYLESARVLETSAFDPARAARVVTRTQDPVRFLDHSFLRRVANEERGVAVFLPTRAEVEAAAAEIADRAPHVHTAFYHGGEPIRVIRPFLDGTGEKPFLLTMTAAGQSALNIRGLDTVVIYDARYANIVQHGRNVLTRKHLGPNEILQMAGRVHGRVANGEVYILTDRNIDFASLRPVPPEFQLAGDTERVALTAAALGVDLSELELPVPLDRRAYARSIDRLSSRGIVEDGRLTPYGRDVEAMPVDRPWGELLVQCDASLMPYVAVAANVDSLHRMTRDESDLSGLLVYGSDHLSAYNAYAEALNQHGYTGEVFGLPRHQFDETIDQWAEHRGVLVKAIEDVALGMAAVYRTLELPLSAHLPYATKDVLRQFRDLVASIMSFDLVIDGETADGERVRISRSSLCSSNGVVAGTIRYFADRFGVPRAAIEGTDIPYNLIRKYATTGTAKVELRDGRDPGLFITRTNEYFGFQLDRVRRPLKGTWPEEHADAVRDELVDALIDGRAPHAQQPVVKRAASRLDEYWRRSSGTLMEASPQQVRRELHAQVRNVTNFDEFLATRLSLDPDAMVPDSMRDRLDQLPSSVTVLGDRLPLAYDFENGEGVVRLRLREKQARRLRAPDVPDTDRAIQFSVCRGNREVARAGSIDELKSKLHSLRDERRQKGRRGRGRRRR